MQRRSVKMDEREEILEEVQDIENTEIEACEEIEEVIEETEAEIEEEFEAEEEIEDDDDEETPYEELTDEEKDARDYQLQRAMEMVIAMSKMQERANVSPTDIVPAGDDKEKSETDKK